MRDDNVKINDHVSKCTMSIADLSFELGVSRKVAAAWGKQYLHYKVIGRQYIFSRKEFLQIIEDSKDIVYRLDY